MTIKDVKIFLQLPGFEQYASGYSMDLMDTMDFMDNILLDCAMLSLIQSFNILFCGEKYFIWNGKCL